MERGALTHSDLAPPMQPYRENPRRRRQARVAAAGRGAARAARAAITQKNHSGIGVETVGSCLAQRCWVQFSRQRARARGASRSWRAASRRATAAAFAPQSQP